jgi:hypothetical protein
MNAYIYSLNFTTLGGFLLKKVFKIILPPKQDLQIWMKSDVEGLEKRGGVQIVH